MTGTVSTTATAVPTAAPEPTIHLKNTITAEIGRMRNTPDFAWDHRVGERILAVIAAHYGCSCGYGTHPTPADPTPADVVTSVANTIDEDDAS